MFISHHEAESLNKCKLTGFSPLPVLWKVRISSMLIVSSPFWLSKLVPASIGIHV